MIMSKPERTIACLFVFLVFFKRGGGGSIRAVRESTSVDFLCVLDRSIALNEGRDRLSGLYRTGQ